LTLSEDQKCTVRSVADPTNVKVVVYVHDAPVTTGDVDSSNSIAVTASTDGIVAVWDVTNGTILGGLLGHVNPVEAVVFFPNTKFVVTTSTDKTIRIWNTQNLAQVAIFSTPSYCSTIAVCPTGTKIFAGDSSGHVYMLSFHSV